MARRRIGKKSMDYIKEPAGWSVHENCGKHRFWGRHMPCADAPGGKTPVGG